MTSPPPRWPGSSPVTPRWRRCSSGAGACPVHWPKYTPDFTRITTRVISIRVHLDLVILADGGGQRFRDSRIKEIVLPIWFNHSATHDPAVWQQQNLPARL